MNDLLLFVTGPLPGSALPARYALDDFGTGYSSLSYVARLPASTLKIDKSFVADMAVSPEKLAIISAIISLGHALDMKIVAEGVETEEQAKLLRLLRCNELQGFLYSKAVPLQQIEAMLASQEDAVAGSNGGQGAPLPGGRSYASPRS